MLSALCVSIIMKFLGFRYLNSELFNSVSDQTKRWLQLGKSRDLESWEMYPSMVNAYFNPPANEVCSSRRNDQGCVKKFSVELLNFFEGVCSLFQPQVDGGAVLRLLRVADGNRPIGDIPQKASEWNLEAERYVLGWLPRYTKGIGETIDIVQAVRVLRVVL